MVGIQMACGKRLGGHQGLGGERPRAFSGTMNSLCPKEGRLGSALGLQKASIGRNKNPFFLVCALSQSVSS